MSPFSVARCNFKKWALSISCIFTAYMTPQPALIPNPKNKIHYIDNLKILLTVLVILHHTFITFGAPGGWYYTQKTTQMGALIPMTLFVAVNQAFFMGFFFFLSAYFISPSYNRKGAGRFVGDRLLRLGIPLLFYSFVFSPFINYLVYKYGQGHHIGYLQYLSGFDDWIDFGVLWFVAALLLFTLCYVVSRLIFKGGDHKKLVAPSTGMILVAAIIAGAISFLVRTVFPVGWVLKPVGFQLGHFTQYIAMFVFGLMAYKDNWLESLKDKTGKQMCWIVVLLILFFPVLFVVKTATHMPIEWYSGGWHWQSLLYAVWEQSVGFAIITVLLSYGKRFWNKTSVLLSKLSRYTFAVYIFHPLLVISLSLAVKDWAIDPALKLLVVAPMALIGSFLLGSVITAVPGVKKII